MTDEQHIDRISKAALGGFGVQSRMAPPYREKLSDEQIRSFRPRRAVVNILLYPKEGEFYLPLILRSSHGKDVHRGQISLPGGKPEPADSEDWHTARRETCEEIGIAQEIQCPIRPLSNLYIPPSNFWVGVWLSKVDHTPVFRVDSREVEAVVEVSVREVVSALRHPGLMVPRPGLPQVPCLEFGNFNVWGATAMILSEFGDLWQNTLPL